MLQSSAGPWAGEGPGRTTCPPQGAAAAPAPGKIPPSNTHTRETTDTAHREGGVPGLHCLAGEEQTPPENQGHFQIMAIHKGKAAQLLPKEPHGNVTCPPSPMQGPRVPRAKVLDTPASEDTCHDRGGLRRAASPHHGPRRATSLL